MAQTARSTQDELTRRHGAARLAVVGMLVFTLLLVAFALTGLFALPPSRNPALEGALRIAIVFFGLGAIALRRTRFAPARLQDIAGLRGASGLLETLQKTTVYVALIGGAIALMGFAITLMTGSGTDMIWLGIIAAAVLLYAYPRRGAWARVVEAAQQGGAARASAAKGTAA